MSIARFISAALLGASLNEFDSWVSSHEPKLIWAAIFFCMHISVGLYATVYGEKTP